MEDSLGQLLSYTKRQRIMEVSEKKRSKPKSELIEIDRD